VATEGSNDVIVIIGSVKAGWEVVDVEDCCGVQLVVFDVSNVTFLFSLPFS